MSDPLDPCPFCGCKTIATEERKVGGKPFRASYWYETACDGCGANTTSDTAEEAEAKWRRRVPEKPATAPDLIHYHYSPAEDALMFRFGTPAVDLHFMSYYKKTGAIIINEHHLQEIITQIRLLRGLP